MANQTDFELFLENLGAFESGINPQKTYGPHDLDWLNVFNPSQGNVDRDSVDISNPDDLSMLQYHVHNTIGFMGKYQFGEPLLIDLGYYIPAASGFYGSTTTNEWKGTWTGKNGVHSKEDFMSAKQELAIREAFEMNMGIIETRLGQADKTIDDYLGQEFTYTHGGETYTTTVTMSGIIASAHLQGPGGVANLLLNGAVSHDEYGTNILLYMDKFAGYDTPFGTSADDTLVGSDYSEVFVGGEGDNTYITDEGFDNVVIDVNPGGTDTVKDFDVTKDVLSLSKLNVDFPDLVIYDNADGHAQFDINGQSVILENVSAAELTPAHFVQGAITLGWNANSGDRIIENFNAHHDWVDLSYAFNNANLAVYEEDGSSVIEVVGNNQRLVLKDFPFDQLDAFHFIKAPIGFAEHFFGDGSNNTAPPVDETPSNPVDETPMVEPTPAPTPTTPEVVPQGDAYSFTWNWGATETINNFDIAANYVDLHHFWTSFDNIDIYGQGNDTVIDLSTVNNQKIVLAGISVADLTAEHIYGVTGSFAEALTQATTPEPTPEPAPEPTPEPTPDTGSSSGESDVYAYSWNWGENSVIDNFDVNSDKIDLSKFWIGFDRFDIVATDQGDTIIDLGDLNNQTIKLVGVDASQLSEANFLGVNGDINTAYVNEPILTDDSNGNSDSGPTEVFSFTWGWNSHHTVDSFDTQSDVIDLSAFWLSSKDEISIHDDEDGNVVIDLTAVNNQTITLTDVSANDLNDSNIVI